MVKTKKVEVKGSFILGGKLIVLVDTIQVKSDEVKDLAFAELEKYDSVPNYVLIVGEAEKVACYDLRLRLLVLPLEVLTRVVPPFHLLLAH